MKIDILATTHDGDCNEENETVTIHPGDGGCYTLTVNRVWLDNSFHRRVTVNVGAFQDFGHLPSVTVCNGGRINYINCKRHTQRGKMLALLAICYGRDAEDVGIPWDEPGRLAAYTTDGQSECLYYPSEVKWTEVANHPAWQLEDDPEDASHPVTGIDADPNRWAEPEDDGKGLLELLNEIL